MFAKPSRIGDSLTDWPAKTRSSHFMRTLRARVVANLGPLLVLTLALALLVAAIGFALLLLSSFPGVVDG